MFLFDLIASNLTNVKSDSIKDKSSGQKFQNKSRLDQTGKSVIVLIFRNKISADGGINYLWSRCNLDE